MFEPKSVVPNPAGAAAIAGQARPSPLRRVRQVFAVREIGVLLALVLMIIVFWLSTDSFMNGTNLLNVGRQVSLLGIMAVGMSFVIIQKEIDLSVGSIYGLAAVVLGVLMSRGQPIWFSCLIGLIAAALVGLFNGWLSTYGKLPSFIVTLGTLSVARGAALIIAGGLPITLTTDTVADPGLGHFFYVGQGKLFGFLPMQLVFFIIVAAAGVVLLHLTSFGFRTYAVGGSERAARVSGINVFLVKIIAFVILGVLCGFAGLLSVAFLGTIQPTTGSGLELDVIAAVIIGGSSLGGGEGTIWGTAIGVLLIGFLRNGLILLGVSPFWQVAVIGLVVILAVAIDKWVTGRLIAAAKGKE